MLGAVADGAGLLAALFLGDGPLEALDLDVGMAGQGVLHALDELLGYVVGVLAVGGEEVGDEDDGLAGWDDARSVIADE